ncbi:MAG: element excision factor XisH family protein [Cyanobacteria bacterium P01_C01_bin.89]
MPQRDSIHEAVRNALIRDGWTITADPFSMRYEELRVMADLAAEKSLLAERGTESIVVEIKTFGGRSFVRELEMALGQYFLYERILTRLQLPHKLYLATSQIAYDAFLVADGARAMLRDGMVSLIVVNLEQERVTQWID